MNAREQPMIRAEAGILTVAGLFGALGVASAAAAAHLDAPMLETASSMLLAHAPALLGLAAARALTLAPRGLLTLAAGLLALGGALFCGDLASRVYLGDRLFPMAAPIGGSSLILGWAVAALAGLAALVRPAPSRPSSGDA